MDVVTTWGEAVEAWRNYMRAAALPESTISIRVYHLGRLAASGVSREPATLTLDELTAWLGRQQWAPNTRRAYRTSLRAFYGWAMATGRVSSSPAHLLPTVKVPRSKPRPVGEPAYRAALTISDRRAWRAIKLAGGCGLRRGEVAQVRREDIEPDLLGWALRVVGKGGHVRLVPLPDDLAADLLAGPAGWVFPSPRGGHLTPHHLGKVISAHLPAGVTTHNLRHRFGTVALRENGNLRVVQELLGHADPRTTAIYTQVDAAELRACVEAVA